MIFFTGLIFLGSCKSPSQQRFDEIKTGNENQKPQIQNKPTSPKIEFVQVVKFKSTLPDSLVLQTINERKKQFEKVTGLVQKYYMKEKSTGEYSAIYLWASEQDFLNYRQSELGKTIGSAYKTAGKPRVELFEMLFPLRPESE